MRSPRGRDRFSAPLHAVAALLAASCAGEDGGASIRSPVPDAALVADAKADQGGGHHACVAPEGVDTAPNTIAEVVTLVNALPSPVTLECFVEALARPLAMHAVDSTVSAQPAQGERSPRMFVFFPGLTLSVVPEGPGAHLLEAGEERAPDRTLKAELEFPIETPIDEAAPYQRVYYSELVTTCGFCHQGEQPASDVASDLAFISPALRPQPWQRVPLVDVQSEAERCDGAAEPERCALLHALFDAAPAPLEHEFPESYRTFF